MGYVGAGFNFFAPAYWRISPVPKGVFFWHPAISLRLWRSAAQVPQRLFGDDRANVLASISISVRQGEITNLRLVWLPTNREMIRCSPRPPPQWLVDDDDNRRRRTAMALRSCWRAINSIQSTVICSATGPHNNATFAAIVFYGRIPLDCDDELRSRSRALLQSG